MKKFLFIFSSLLLSSVIISCSSDDNDGIPSTNIDIPSTNTHSIVGTWKYIKGSEKAIVEGTNLDDVTKQKIIDTMDPAPGSNGEIHLTFNSDGTGMFKHFEDNEIDTFTYIIDNNIIKVTSTLEGEDHEQETGSFEINGNILTINSPDYGELKYFQNLYPEAGITRTDVSLSYEKM